MNPIPNKPRPFLLQKDWLPEKQANGMTEKETNIKTRSRGGVCRRKLQQPKGQSFDFKTAYLFHYSLYDKHINMSG